MARQTSRRRSAPRYIATRGPSYLPFKSPSERGTNSEGMTWDEWRTAAGTGGLTTKKLLDAWQAGEDPAEHRPARLRSNRRGSRRLVSLFKNSRRRTSLRRNSDSVGPTTKKGDRVEFTYRGEKVSGKVVKVKKDGTVTVDVEGHSDEDVGWVDIRLPNLKRNSRRRGSLRRNSYTSTPAGKKVVMAFLDRRPADSAKLTTDGKRLDGTWMGGRGIAEWVGDKIVFGELGSRSSQTIQNLIRREAPANWLKPNRRRGSMRRNSSLVKKGADASALALIERIEHAVDAGDSNVAAITFERLDQWKERHGKWPFEAKRYWRAVHGMQALGMRRNGRRSRRISKKARRTSVSKREALSKLTYAWKRQYEGRKVDVYDAMKLASDMGATDAEISTAMDKALSLRRNSSFGPARDQAASRARNAFARGDKAAANRALAELRAIDISLMPRAVRKNGRRMRHNPPIEFDAETRALAQRVYGQTPVAPAPRKWIPMTANRRRGTIR